MASGVPSTSYQFSFGPWNISTGADPFGPPVRRELEFARKIKAYKELGFDAVQFHDDDIVPADLDWPATKKGVAAVKAMLEGEGLFVEIVAPRLWEDPRTDRRWLHGEQRQRPSLRPRPCPPDGRYRPRGRLSELRPLARARGVVHPRSEGRQDCRRSDRRCLERDPGARPRDPRPGRGEAERADGPGLPPDGRPHDRYRPQNIDPDRSGVLIESAHSILAGLDPADDMAYALYHDKLWSVHLNDQNGLKYDQDKVFGSVDLRRAFNQVWVLDKNGYDRTGACVGLDVKAMRTTVIEESISHLANSRTMFLRLLDIVPHVDESASRHCAGPPVRGAGNADPERTDGEGVRSTSRSGLCDLRTSVLSCHVTPAPGDRHPQAGRYFCR